jgi:hypothetical protein
MTTEVGLPGPPPARDRQWLLSLLPAFPVVLLVLRLWYLSGQDVATMLLLVQHVSPLGLISALLISLIWVFPVIVLVTGALGALLRASSPDPLRSRLGRATAREPGWVLALAALIAAITWQLRFLPALVMLSLMIVGLRSRVRHDRRVWWVFAVALPVAVAVAEYAWAGPAIVTALRTGETVTAILLLVPPAVTVVLTGPIPAGAAHPVISRTALAAGLLAPFVVGALFLRAPVLPIIALEVAGDTPGSTSAVLRGYVIDVDDTMTTLLDDQGEVRFLPNSQVRSKALCPGAARPPASSTEVHGWPVEQTVLQWVAPSRRATALDPRCQGRPLSADGAGRGGTALQPGRAAPVDLGADVFVGPAQRFGEVLRRLPEQALSLLVPGRRGRYGDDRQVSLPVVKAFIRIRHTDQIVIWPAPLWISVWRPAPARWPGCRPATAADPGPLWSGHPAPARRP